MKGAQLVVPPLRARDGDLSNLLWSFLSQERMSSGKLVTNVSPSAMAALERYDWPGSVRELRGVVEHAMRCASGHVIEIEVWMHGGFDIVSFSILLFALSRTTPTPWILRAVGLAGLMPTIAITISLVATPYWSPLFVVAAAGCLAFSVGSFVLARSSSTAAT